MHNSFIHPVITGLETIASREAAVALCSVVSVHACSAAHEAGWQNSHVSSINFTFVNEAGRSGNLVRADVLVVEAPCYTPQAPRRENHVWEIAPPWISIISEEAPEHQ